MGEFEMGDRAQRAGRPGYRLTAAFVLSAVLSLAGCHSSGGNPSAGGSNGPGGGAGGTAAQKLRQAGRWLIDPQGRVVILHGLNLINKLPPYTPSAIGFGEDDAQFIAAQGWNTVRTGITHKGFALQPGVYDGAYLEDVAGTIDVLANAGIYVLFDVHQDMYNERYQGEGMADWATFDSWSGDPTVFPMCNLGFPGNMFACPFMWEAFDRFFGLSGRTTEIGPRGRTLVEEYAEAWQVIAARFRDEPYVFGYDIFNEPVPGSQVLACMSLTGCPPGADDALTAFSNLVANAIRQVDPRTIVYYEPFATNFNAGFPTLHGDLDTDQVGFSFHVYGCPSSLVPFVLPEEITTLCGPLAEDRVYDNADSQATTYGHTPLVTEFGATDDLATIDRVADLADAHMTGWQYWAWWNEDPSAERPNEGIIDHPSNPPTDEHLDLPKLDVLARPYPRAIAGTPTGWSWDETAKHFEFGYSTQAASGTPLTPGALTEAWIPQRHFPDGYQVQVSGASVQSAPNAARLVLANNPGATEVTVTITRP
jgi:endoglycosylceramidase